MLVILQNLRFVHAPLFDRKNKNIQMVSTESVSEYPCIFCQFLNMNHDRKLNVPRYRIFISKYRKDQKYCEEGLCLLTLLARQFERADAREEDIKEAQQRSLHLLMAVWYSSNFPSLVALR